MRDLLTSVDADEDDCANGVSEDEFVAEVEAANVGWW